MSFLWICVTCFLISEWQYKPAEPPEAKTKKKQRKVQRGYTKARYECFKAQIQRYGYQFCVVCRGTELDIGPDGRFLTFTTDHITPYSWYNRPTVTAKELQVMCNPCNLGKSNNDDIDYRTNR